MWLGNNVNITHSQFNHKNDNKLDQKATVWINQKINRNPRFGPSVPSLIHTVTVSFVFWSLPFKLLYVFLGDFKGSSCVSVPCVSVATDADRVADWPLWKDEWHISEEHCLLSCVLRLRDTSPTCTRTSEMDTTSSPCWRCSPERRWWAMVFP